MLRHLKPNKVKYPAEILLSRQLSSVDYEGIGHMKLNFKITDRFLHSAVSAPT